MDELTRSVRRLLEQLLVVFVVLKLVHVITWSWWAILVPVWVPLLVAGVFIVGAMVADFFGDVFYALAEWGWLRRG